ATRHRAMMRKRMVRLESWERQHELREKAGVRCYGCRRPRRAHLMEQQTRGNSPLQSSVRTLQWTNYILSFTKPAYALLLPSSDRCSPIHHGCLETLCVSILNNLMV